MRIDNEAGELRATLRPAAGIVATIGAFAGAAFVFAIAAASASVFLLLTGRPPAFLAAYRDVLPWREAASRGVLIGAALWTLMWIFFSASAIASLLRTLLGSDVVVAGSDLAVTKRIGPFGRTRSFARQSVRAVAVRRKDGVLTVALDDDSVAELTASGTPRERKQLRDLLRERLQLTADTGATLATKFEVEHAPDGTRIVRVSAASRRRTAGCGAVIVALWLGAVAWHFINIRSVDLMDPMVLVAVLLIGGFVFVVRAEESWQVKKGWFAYDRRFGPYHRRTEYDSANFSVEESRDSDGDVSFTLNVERDGRRERLHSAADEPGEVVSLGRFLARESGFPFYGLREE